VQESLSEQIAALPTLNKAQLLAIWAEDFSKDPPPKLRKELMVPVLAGYRRESSEGYLTPPDVDFEKLLLLSKRRNPPKSDPIPILKPAPDFSASGVTKPMRSSPPETDISTGARAIPACPGSLGR
jgi:hypothetical protein